MAKRLTTRRSERCAMVSSRVCFPVQLTAPPFRVRFADSLPLPLSQRLVQAPSVRSYSRILTMQLVVQKPIIVCESRVHSACLVSASGLACTCLHFHARYPILASIMSCTVVTITTKNLQTATLNIVSGLFSFLFRARSRIAPSGKQSGAA
jgi:hypothetical protein